MEERQIRAVLAYAGEKVEPRSQEELSRMVAAYSCEQIGFRLRRGYVVDAWTTLNITEEEFTRAVIAMRKRERRYFRPGILLRLV